MLKIKALAEQYKSLHMMWNEMNGDSISNVTDISTNHEIKENNNISQSQPKSDFKTLVPPPAKVQSQYKAVWDKIIEIYRKSRA